MTDSRIAAVGTCSLGPPVVPFLTLFGGEGSPTKTDVLKKLVPTYSNLFTGGPTQFLPGIYLPLPNQARCSEV